MAVTLALVQRVLTALILCLAILLGIAGNASGAFTQRRLENRVGDFGDPIGDYAGFDGLQALEPHREITILVYDPVTDVWFYGHDLISQDVHQPGGAFAASFHLYDGHGSVRQLTDSLGAVTDAYSYDAFGVLIDSHGATANRYLFAGEQFDSALGLYYNRARYLNPSSAVIRSVFRIINDLR